MKWADLKPLAWQQLHYYTTGNQPIPADMQQHAESTLSGVYDHGFAEARTMAASAVQEFLKGTPDGQELADLLSAKIKDLKP